MNLRYYHDLFYYAVNEMALSPGSFNKKLSAAWHNYIYKVSLRQLESVMIDEDQPVFQNLKKRLFTDLKLTINMERECTQIVSQSAKGTD